MTSRSSAILSLFNLTSVTVMMNSSRRLVTRRSAIVTNGKRFGNDQQTTARPKRDGCFRPRVRTGEAVVELRSCGIAIALFPRARATNAASSAAPRCGEPCVEAG